MERLAHIVRVWVLWIARVAMVSMTNVNVCTPDSIEGAGFLVLLAMAQEKFMLSAIPAMAQAGFDCLLSSPIPWLRSITMLFRHRKQHGYDV